MKMPISCEVKKVGNGFVVRYIYQTTVEELVFLTLKEMTEYMTQVFTPKKP